MIDLRIALLPLLLSFACAAGELDHNDFLPPTQPWTGASEALVVADDDPWVTPSELGDLETTPSYDETFAWLERLDEASDDIEIVTLGLSAEGRAIRMVIASKAQIKTPAALAADGRPIVFAQSGIHSGEIDGKDAGLMLLRDLTVAAEGESLLEKVHFLFIPILSVDAHEHGSRHSRINQRGPIESGWRTNAHKLNPNRDYSKLETAGARASVRVLAEWNPDLFLDLHVTDGSDYQYDLTWGYVVEGDWAPASKVWVDEHFTPSVTAYTEAQGHIPGPFIWPVNGIDYRDGMVQWQGSPRFSQVYGAARQMPAILLENHSLKPYPQRVLGTYVFLEATLELVGREAESLSTAIATDRSGRPDEYLLAWKTAAQAKVSTRMIKGIASQRVESPITGAQVVRWTGEPIEVEVDFFNGNVPGPRVERPQAYLIPPAWAHIARKLELHGIVVERLGSALSAEVELYRLPDAGPETSGSAFDHSSLAYEGRVLIDPGEIHVETEELSFPAGSFRVDTDQPLGLLAALLLEPASPDSLFQWGFFLEILSRTEYAEAYVMEPMARAMLDADPELAKAFAARLASDPDFAADPEARLLWFYRKTAYYDRAERLYPIARLPR